jgi:hypothetical protein
MSEFLELVRGFCIIAVSGGLVIIMAPDGNLKKYVKFIVSLCMVCALFSAFLSFSASAKGILSGIVPKVQDTAVRTEEELYLGVAKQAKKNLEAELRALLGAHLGISEGDIYVVAEIDTADLSAVEITKITVFLHDTEHGERARAYLDDCLMGSVQIDIKKKG